MIHARRLFFLLIASMFLLPIQAQQLVELFIVEGAVTDGENGWIPYYTFNTQDAFDSSNVTLRFDPGAEIEFSVVNQTTITCGFSIQGMGSTGPIPAGESRSLQVFFDDPGVYLFEDPMTDHRALGLGGLVVVSASDHRAFYGVYNEHDREWTKALTLGGAYSKKDYNPEAFTVNGRGFPDVKRDSLISIRGGVGDTILIHLANAGQMFHFPHFHGFHVKILEATKHPQYIGRWKDSFGMAPGECVTLQLVPDKPGHYPIHDHNLVTTTVGGNYPGGLMIHMSIHE